MRRLALRHSLELSHTRVAVPHIPKSMVPFSDNSVGPRGHMHHANALSHKQIVSMLQVTVPSPTSTISNSLIVPRSHDAAGLVPCSPGLTPPSLVPRRGFILSHSLRAFSLSSLSASLLLVFVVLTLPRSSVTPPTTGPRGRSTSSLIGLD